MFLLDALYVAVYAPPYSHLLEAYLRESFSLLFGVKLLFLRHANFLHAMLVSVYLPFHICLYLVASIYLFCLARCRNPR